MNWSKELTDSGCRWTVGDLEYEFLHGLNMCMKCGDLTSKEWCECELQTKKKYNKTKVTAVTRFRNGIQEPLARPCFCACAERPADYMTEIDRIINNAVPREWRRA